MTLGLGGGDSCDLQNSFLGPSCVGLPRTPGNLSPRACALPTRLEKMVLLIGRTHAGLCLRSETPVVGAALRRHFSKTVLSRELANL